MESYVNKDTIGNISKLLALLVYEPEMNNFEEIFQTKNKLFLKPKYKSTSRNISIIIKIKSLIDCMIDHIKTVSSMLQKYASMLSLTFSESSSDTYLLSEDYERERLINLLDTKFRYKNTCDILFNSCIYNKEIKRSKVYLEPLYDGKKYVLQEEEIKQAEPPSDEGTHLIRHSATQNIQDTLRHHQYY